MAKNSKTVIQAWDNREKRWVTAKDINKAEYHDANRYFTDKFEYNEDKGDILTVVREHPRKNRFKPEGEKITIPVHFTRYKENTKYNRECLKKKIDNQESYIHKAAKSLFNNGDIRFIAVNEVNTTVAASNVTLLNKCILRIVKVVSVELKDKITNKIPDITLIVDINGIEQEFFIEICYKHSVDENKRKSYLANNKNCIEVDVRYLQDNLDESAESVKRKLKKAIETNCNNTNTWISSRLKQMFDANASRYIVDRHLGHGFEYTTTGKGYDKGLRLFCFRTGTTNFDEDHPMYLVENPDVKYAVKTCSVKDCLNCVHCIAHSGVDSDNIHDVHVYCNRSTVNIFNNVA